MNTLTQSNNRAKIINIIIILFAILLGLVFIFPIYWMVRSSVVGLKDLYANPPVFIPTSIETANYIGAIQNIKFVKQFLNSVTISGSVVIGTLVTSGFAAFAFARLRFPFKKLWFSLIISTMMLPSAVTLIPQFIMWNKLGIVGTLLPLTIPAWFGGAPFYIFMLRQFFYSIPRELDEAAKIDGVGYLRLYFQIIMPLSKPAFIVVALFSFIHTWNEFFYTMIYLQGKEELYTLTLALYSFKGVHQTNYSQIMALATITSLPTLIFFLIGNKYFVEGIATSGIKG